MDAELLGELVDRPLALDRLQGDLSLKYFSADLPGLGHVRQQTWLKPVCLSSCRLSEFPAGLTPESRHGIKRNDLPL